MLRAGNRPENASSLISVLDALAGEEAAPPLENWIMTGELMSRAACSTALIVDVEVQLNAKKIGNQIKI